MGQFLCSFAGGYLIGGSRARGRPELAGGSSQAAEGSSSERTGLIRFRSVVLAVLCPLCLNRFGDGEQIWMSQGCDRVVGSLASRFREEHRRTL